MPKELFGTASKDKWEMIGTARRSGVVAPLFFVYSKKSAGIGDFEDLKLLIDWCAASGNAILQLLPLNDTGPTSCPYDGVSSFALEPAYIALGPIAGSRAASRLRAMFPAGSGRVDYRIKEEKLKLLREAYSGHEGEAIEKFKEENDYWIDDYAVFKVLKGHHGGRPWYEWEAKYKERDSRPLKLFAGEHRTEIEFEIWVQWLLYGQLKSSKEYAGSKKVFIKGDLPILISRDSADVWAHREFFKLEYAAGAPPDMYCAKGQRWGMPTYDWGRIEADDYRYLKRRLKYAENFYDMLRLDHVVGLFRIWSIPHGELPENEGLNGFFDPKDEKIWGARGENILSVILKNQKTLVCAEDLGIIPKICPETLKKLGIPGNDVQRWTKDWSVKHDFLKPADYRLLSVAMLSTHDTTNWAAWWENEAGTVDEAFFMRKCAERGVDYIGVREKLFDTGLSRHGRLRWLNKIAPPKILAETLGKKEEEIRDLIDIYQNSYQEKEKLWKHLGLSGPMRERSDPEIVKAALQITLKSNSIFCIELVTDLLSLAGIFKGDPYRHRINRPGTISDENWSMTIPIPLEDLLKHKVTKAIRSMVKSSGRLSHG